LQPHFDLTVCPFPGLGAYTEENARFFFGRQSETLDALRKLGMGLNKTYRRWLLVEGPSKIGKSSLVKDGLIPSIKQGWFGKSQHTTRESSETRSLDHYSVQKINRS